MKRSQREAAARGSTHLLRLSLPAVRSNGSFEGADILAEAGAVPAILLCQVYRAVMAWALTPAAEHEGLFPPHAAAETRRLMGEVSFAEELKPALDVVCELLDDPVQGDPQRIAEACIRIGEWADGRGNAPKTTFRFLQASGTCAPNDARLAYRAGYVARRQAVWDVAELWFRHSTTVSRRNRDWHSHATAYLALGNSYYRQGRYPSARREHLKALRVAKRHGLREVQGKAYHDLFAVAVEMREPDRAEEYGQAAFHAYGPTHRTIPALAHDIAYFWNTRGMYGRALPVFSSLLPHFRASDHYLSVVASLGRAAGGVGDRAMFQKAWEEAADLSPALEHSAVLVTSMLELAYGAAEMREWQMAESAAMRAVELAARHGEADVVSLAERLLTSIASNRRVEAEAGAVSPTPLYRERADRFVTDLIDSLDASASALAHVG